MKRIRVLIFTVALITLTIALAGCGPKQVTYTLSFEPNGGSTIESLSTDGESAITIPSDPTKDGYTFDGWYWDNDVWEEPVTVDSLVNSPISTDMTIFAKWTESLIITIIFDSNDGSATTDVTTDRVSAILFPTEPVKSGYVFDGWYWDNNVWAEELVMGNSYMDAPTSNNFTVYAKWTESNIITIIFDSTGGSATTDVTTDKVSTILFPTEPLKSGFNFAGWYWDNNVWAEELVMGNSYMDAPTPNNFTVYAKWTESTDYTIVFNSNGGTSIDSIVNDGVTTFPFPSNPTKDGFEFDGWYKDNDIWENRLLAETMFDDVPVSREIHLYAKWIEIPEYTIIFNSNGGTSITSIVTDGTTTFPFPSNPTKDGFEFDGWYMDNDIWESRLLAETMFDNPNNDNEIHLYAKWIVVTYTVTLVENGGNALDINSYVLSIGDDYTFPVPGNTESVFFTGWYTALEDGTKVELTGQWTIEADTTLYAMWSPYLRVDDYIYFGYYPQTIKTNDVSITTSTPDTEGYYLGSDGFRYAKVVSDPFYDNYKFSDDSLIVSGETYYFKVEPIKWRILEETDGLAIILSTIGIETHIYDETSPVYESSSLRAWLNNEFYSKAFTDYHNALIETTLIDNSASTTGSPDTIYASADTFDNISIMSYQDMVNTAYGYNTEPYFEDPLRKTLLSDYVRSKHAYMSDSTSEVLDYYGKGFIWLRSPNSEHTVRYLDYSGIVGNTSHGYSTVPVAPVVRIQLNEISTYTVTFDTNDGSLIDPISVNNHSSITLPPAPTKENYSFGGWYYDDETFMNIVEFPHTLNKDVTVYANWVSLYTLTFNSDGGTDINATTQSSLTEIFAPVEPVKDGFVFRGWFYEDTYTNAVIFPTTLNEDKTIYAEWTVVDTTPYVRVDYLNLPASNGEYVLFGEYPQTLKEDSVLITSQTPNSDGYYLGSDGERYAKVVATPYSDFHNYTYNFNNGSEIIEGITYYFKVEPIKWRILEISDGSAIILSTMLLDNHRFDDDTNNYAESEVRAWLNDQFYNNTFNTYQKAIIETTLVDNSLSTTRFPEEGANTCEDTNDKIFLMSYVDMKRAGYGFDSDDNVYDVARRRTATDYTRSMGTYIYAGDLPYYGFGDWWLRTPYYLSSSLTNSILYHGSGQLYINVDTEHNGGIVPALTITLD